MKDRWSFREARQVFDAGIFQLREDNYLFDGAPTRPFYVLESRPWVNVVAVTEAGDAVLVRQYRHGVREVSLEVPGGLVDEGEEPAEAAARELLEETGYAGDDPELLVSVSNNPAILDNRTYCYLVRNARRVGPQCPDEHEVIEVTTAATTELSAMIRSGSIHHSLCVVAIYAYLAAHNMG